MLSTKKAENNSEDNEALVASQGKKYTVGSGKEELSTKKAENNSEDAEAQVVA
jgi:hypothetical protein